MNNIDSSNNLLKNNEINTHKNMSYYKINDYKDRTNNKSYSFGKNKGGEETLNGGNFSEKNTGPNTGYYNVKNININFNNIKVVNNISKKYSSIDNENKKGFNNISINKIESVQYKEENLNSIMVNNTINDENLMKKIKVSKVKSSLNFPKKITKSMNNIKPVKKKIVKGKSQNNLRVKKKVKIMKIDSCTIEGKSFKQKYNQENFFMKEKFLNQSEQFLIGICNGHGKHGKFISKYIINLLPKLFTDITDNDIINTYLQMNKHIISENNKIFDCSLSGASCISLIVTLEKIISINLGDNKAVLARHENGLYNFVNLNREHKPTEPDEKKRILEHNGKIGYSYENKSGPKKIWLKNSDIPGLPISRSFGDVIAHSVGVISEPEIKSFYFNGNEKFIILASNEFWEIIDSEESVNIVKDFYENEMDAIGALNKIAFEILKKCENKQKTINDDITIIIVFFE